MIELTKNVIVWPNPMHVFGNVYSTLQKHPKPLGPMNHLLIFYLDRNLQSIIV